MRVLGLHVGRTLGTPPRGIDEPERVLQAVHQEKMIVGSACVLWFIKLETGSPVSLNAGVK